MMKEKSWSVRLVSGSILDNKVKTYQCKDCQSTAKLVLVNKDDPNLLLYGCNGNKCKHALIRVKVAYEGSPS
jgi:predicted nucleic acid-binding Zn ribbon protein